MKLDRTPIPDQTGKNGRAVWGFEVMQVGDSTFFENYPSGSQSLPAMAARAHGRYYQKKFMCRSIDGGVRIWRVA